MPLEQLRIVAECAAGRRAHPESEPSLRRLHESIRFAADHHSADQIAEAAEMVPAAVDSILERYSPRAPETSRHWGFARSAGTFRHSPA
jgi:hypothetical protein